MILTVKSNNIYAPDDKSGAFILYRCTNLSLYHNEYLAEKHLDKYV